MTLENWISAVKPADPNIAQASRERWDSIAKPLGSLGLLEEMLVRAACASRREPPCFDKRCLLVFCADNGVVAQGVTQMGSEVTRMVARLISRGESSVCRMAQKAGCDVAAIDIGMLEPMDEPGMLNARVRPGTGDITVEKAMTRSEAEAALLTGIRLAVEKAKQGYTILLTGEMGIGNTTTSAAVASVCLGRDADELVGRGAGLSDEGLLRKRQAVKKALDLHRPNPNDALDILSKVGGLDLAGMAGVFIGGAAAGVPVVVDGVISAAAALLAVMLCPPCRDYMLAGHLTAEPAGQALLDALQLSAPIHAGLRLGEGTGAVALLPLLDMALAVYTSAATFSDAALAPCVPPEDV